VHRQGAADPRHGRAASPTARQAHPDRRHPRGQGRPPPLHGQGDRRAAHRLTDALAHYLARTAPSACPPRPRLRRRWTA
jgi:hypothetical protein